MKRIANREDAGHKGGAIMVPVARWCLWHMPSLTESAVAHTGSVRRGTDRINREPMVLRR